MCAGCRCCSLVGVGCLMYGACWLLLFGCCLLVVVWWVLLVGVRVVIAVVVEYCVLLWRVLLSVCGLLFVGGC